MFYDDDDAVSQKTSHVELAIILDMHNPIMIIFWWKCYRESRKSYDALFSHLTCLVLLHYLA